jgi:hypothetical protein
MNRRFARLAGLIAAGAMVLSLAGTTSAASDAMVRVLHASPDAPQVDVYVNGAKVAPLSGLNFKDLSAYVAVPGGTYAIKVCATADATICPIDVPALAIAAGKHYTIAATNNLATIEAQVLVDNPSPKTGKAQARVVHFSADTPAVDVLTQDKSAKVVTNLAYPNATGYLTLAPGTYDLIVCANADNTVCPLDPGPLALASGTSYTVFAVGSLTGDTLAAVVGVDGKAAAAVTPPPTDTVGATESAPASPAPIFLLAAIGVLSFIGGLRLVGARSRS